MSSSQRAPHLPAIAATAAIAALALTACSSGSGDSAATPSTTTTSTSTTSTSSAAPTTSSTSPSSTSPSSTTSASSSSTSKSSKPTPSTKTTPPASQAFVTACVSANSKLNDAVSQWNAAVRSGSDSKLDAAAKNFTATGTAVYELRTAAWDPQFTKRAGAVRDALKNMAAARDNGESVSTATFNAKAAQLRWYCQVRIRA